MSYKALLLGLSLSIFTPVIQAEEPIPSKPALTLATTPESSSAMRIVDNQISTELPGYRAELLQKAASNCGYTVEFRLVPWNRALHMVEFGAADGAFRASYKDERAVYGVYPRTADGQIDTARAISDYTYSFYTVKQSDFLWGGIKLPPHANRVAVEASASIIDKLESVGAEVVEARDYQNMLDLLMANRVDALVGISEQLSNKFDSSPIDYSAVEQVDPPLSENRSYVLFSKLTYEKRAEDVECFWTESTKLRRTAWYAERTKYYESNSLK